MKRMQSRLMFVAFLALLPVLAGSQQPSQHIPRRAEEIAGAVNYKVIAPQTGKDITGLSAAEAQKRVISDPLSGSSFKIAEFLLGLGLQPGLPPLIAESGINSGPAAQSSTFTGWAMNAGIQSTPFNLVNIPIYFWDGAHIPTYFHIRIYENNRSGTLKADTLIPAPSPLTALQSNDVTFYLGALITSAQPLWVEIFSDGRFAPYHLPLSPPPYASPPYTHDQYTTGGSLTVPTWVNTSAQLGTYVQFYNTAYITKVIDAGVNFFGAVNFTAPSFTGWMAQIGTPQSIDRAEIDIYPTDAALLPKQIKFQIRENNETGNVVGDSTVLMPTDLTAGAYRRVRVDFQNAVLNPLLTPLVLLIMSDGHIGLRKVTSTSVYASSVGKYATNASVTAPNWALTSTAENDYIKLFNVDYAQINVKQGPITLSPVVTVSQVPYTPVLLLQSKMYGVVGQRKDVYYENILGLADHDWFYNFDIAASLGVQDNYEYDVTPSSGEVGTTNWTISAYKYNQLLATKAVSFIVSSATITTPTTRKVLTIGDSITADGVWLSELVRLCGTSNLTLTTVGTKVSAGAVDSTGGTRTINHEGISGWQVSYFFNSDGTNYPSIPQSPFVFGAGQTFNFATYLSTNGITLSSGDWLLIMLGTNDCFSYTTDSDVNAKFVTAKTQLDVMIANAQAAVPGLRVGVCVTIPPAYQQSAFGNNYGVGQTQWRCLRNVQLWQNSLIGAYDNRQAEGIDLIGTHLALDTFNNMQTTTRAVNSTNSATEVVEWNGVHPALSGKFQIALPAHALLRYREP